MNGLLVAAWLVYGFNSGVQIPYDSIKKCEQAVAVARDKQSDFGIFPLCVSGNNPTK
jgi:hypothetical protein